MFCMFLAFVLMVYVPYLSFHRFPRFLGTQGHRKNTIIRYTLCKNRGNARHNFPYAFDDFPDRFLHFLGCKSCAGPVIWAARFPYCFLKWFWLHFGSLWAALSLPLVPFELHFGSPCLPLGSILDHLGTKWGAVWLYWLAPGLTSIHNGRFCARPASI